MTGLFATKQDLNVMKMVSRMLSAAKLNENTFKELRDNPTATLQSIFLVPISGLCYGLGFGVFGYFTYNFSANLVALVVLLSLVSAGIIAIVWSFTTFLIVARLFRKTVSYPGLVRPFLFSWSPGILFIFLLSPNQFVSDGFRILATAWVAVASIFGVRYAGGLTLQQSMVTFIVSILILIFAQIVFESVLPVFFA